MLTYLRSIRMRAIVAVAVLAMLFEAFLAAKLPDNFLLCHRNDQNLNDCLTKAVQKAIHEIKDGVPSLQLIPTDPLTVTKISIQQGAGRPVSISLDLNNAKVSGLSDAKIITASTDLNKREMEATVLVPLSTLESDYIMDGKFLVLPLKGKGKCKLTFDELEGKLHLYGEPRTKNGKTYWHIHKFDVVIVKMKRFQMHFENLFNGDKALGDNTNKVLNENWKEFWEELKPSFEETFSEVFLQLSNVIFDKVPENDIFLE